MKSHKKTSLILSFTFLSIFSAMAFSSPKGQNLDTFENTVYSDMFKKKLGDIKAITFPGIYNNTIANIQTQKINLGLDVTFGLGTKTENSYNSMNWIDADNIDWYLEFSPEKEVTAILHDKIFLSGSYLPVSDIYLPSANSGSDLGGVLKPIDEIRFSAGVDFPSYFGREDWEPCINVGLDYFHPSYGGFGISVRNIATAERTITATTTFTMVPDLIINAGISHDKESHLGVMGYEEYFLRGTLLSASIDYTYNFFNIKAEIIGNTDSYDPEEYDLYAGAQLLFKLGNNFELFTQGRVLIDFDTEETNLVYLVKPGINFNYFKTSKINISVQFFVDHPDCYLNIPISWTYSF